MAFQFLLFAAFVACCSCISDNCQVLTNVLAATKAVEELRSQFAALQTKVHTSNTVTRPALGFQIALGKRHTPSSKIAFDKVFYNYGNHWNNVTHTFKAPVKGLYSFTLTIMNGNRIVPAWAQISRGDVSIQRCWARDFGDEATATAALVLNAGELVSAKHGGGIIDSNDHDHWTHFVGYLVHKVK